MLLFQWLGDGLSEEGLHWCAQRDSYTKSIDLRPLKSGELVSATNRSPNGAFAPIVDGPSGIMPDLPSRLITQGRFNRIDFIGGHCTGDGNTFAGGNPSQFTTEQDIRTRVFSRWPLVVCSLRPCLPPLRGDVNIHAEHKQSDK